MSTRGNYDPKDVRNGLLIHVTQDNGGDSPMGALTLELDPVYDVLMDDLETGDLSDEHWRQTGYASALCLALSKISCYTVPEVKQQMRIRWQRRQEAKA